MEKNTVVTPLSYSQLMLELRKAYTEIKRALIGFKSSKDLMNKIGNLEQLFRYPAHGEAAIKKIEVKALDELEGLIVTFSKDIPRMNIVDRRQVDQFVLPAFNRTLELFERVQEHVESDLRKCSAMIRILRDKRKTVKKLRKKASRVAIEILNNNQKQVQAQNYQQAA